MWSGVFLSLLLLPCVAEALNSSEWSGWSEAGRRLALASCDLFNGTWIYDAPLYYAPARYDGKCPFMLSPTNCMRQGRPDRNYRLYSYQPHQCHVVRFDAHTFLSLMRGRTIAFVGDSILRWNLFTSILCQLWLVVKPVRNYHNPLIPGPAADEFYIKEYNIRMISIADAFLVASSSSDKILQYYGSHWRKGWDNEVVGVTRFPNPTWGKYMDKLDVLVMETGHHWPRGQTRQRFFVDGWGHLLASQDVVHALRVALLAMRNYFDARKGSGPIPIFLTESPQHGVPRGHPPGTTCGFRGILSPAQLAALKKTNIDYSVYRAAQVAALRSSAVRLMDISPMSLARPDGHVGPWYATGGVLTGAAPYQDCLHWCNPGVPDVWSDLFLALLQRQPRLRRRSSL